MLLMKLPGGSMKSLHHMRAAAILALLLTLSVSAGDIGMPGATSPPPAPPTVTYEIQLPSLPGTSEFETSGLLDPVTEAALSLLQSVLSLF